MPQELVTARRDSWRKHTLSMPEARAKLNFNRVFTPTEYQRISQGLIPAAMEDKWFIFLENETLFFYRSWTGFCIYQVHFVVLNKQYSIDEVWVNRNSEQYKEIDNEYDIKLLNFLIDNFLLEQNTSFPVPNTIPDTLPKGLSQHSVSGTGYSETLYKSKESWMKKLQRIFGKGK
jgi:hypothetical protein